MEVVKAKFNFVRGNTYTRDIEIKNYSKINNIYFTVKEKEQDKNEILKKRLYDGISLVDETENSKTYNLLIDSSDTDNLKTDYDYYFDVKVITNTTSKPIKLTIIKGTMTLVTDITRVFNEEV